MAKQYSLSDIKTHNDNKSTWIVIHNNVYDVTNFLNEHPGGEEVLLNNAGKEASENFELIGHSSDARELMVKYKIGELVESDRKPVETKIIDWEMYKSTNKTASSSSPSSLNSWLITLSLGLVATIVYRIFLQA
ncbi:unnamed protein product [Phaedon cochleariae]|uniref:Cytochrome b5 n=1 Tax=Phaedon cochleariae TaxID=80249 RepID=A0A9P0DEK4_PHACE|nr:unnamed protein product [Phaedon cochleariae]